MQGDFISAMWKKFQTIIIICLMVVSCPKGQGDKNYAEN